MSSADGDGVVPVEREPMHHELWRTATLRVLRADFPAHSTCLWHEHRKYTVYLCITDVDVLEHKYGAETAVPLQLERGSLLCRDHSVEPLVHRATTQNARVVMVGVEIQRPHPTEMLLVPPADDGTCLTAPHSDCVHSDHRSRVYRVQLDPHARVAFTTPWEAVLVALDGGEVRLQDTNQDKAPREQELQLDSGAAVSLPQGSYELVLNRAPLPAITIYLVQIFGY